MSDHSEETALLNATMNAIGDAVVVTDAVGVITRTNPAAEQLFEYDDAELIGANITGILPRSLADYHEDFASSSDDTALDLRSQDVEIEGTKKDGSTVPLRLSLGQTDFDGQSVYVAILHNLTGRRAAQEALARSQRLDAIGQMTGGIAHDFNNLLTVIIGNLELLEMRGVNARQQTLITDSLEAAALGADLTSRLLVFARKGVLKPVKSDLRQLCSDALGILKRTIGENYSIRTDFAEDVHDIIVDPVQLQSALINLAVNARDAMPNGGDFLISVSNITIDDTYMAQETDIEPGQYVRLFVSDNGDGMSTEAQRRAFEPFFTTKADAGGTGLGLSMVYGFVRQSGGHITLYSELGHGTSFGLYFPIEAPNIQPEQSTGSELAEDLIKGRGQRILVVEDNPRVRRLSIERLVDLGYETEAADSGDMAYQMLTDGLQVDLVFSDLVMPGDLNGYDLAALVRRDFPGVRVLLTSGYASDVVTGELGGSDTYDVLHKPYRQSELATRLHALLNASD